MDQFTTQANSARADWEKRIGQRIKEGSEPDRLPILPPPEQVAATSGAGQVTLRWSPVEGAVGYFIYRSEQPTGPFTIIDHGGGDVLAVPGLAYADTTCTPGQQYWYAIASIADAKARPSELSTIVEAQPQTQVSEPLTLHIQAQKEAGQINPLWHMLGGEHLSQLFYKEGPGNSQIGSEYTQAFTMAHHELGARYLRAHAILDDEQNVYREVNGEAAYDFSSVDRIYDFVLQLGFRPIVELSFMPSDLATDVTKTIFTYKGIISPPKNWQRWGELNGRLAAHLVERYGIEEVSQWGFEVWNEPNLKVFWTGTQQEYFRLYDVAARAIKAVDERLKVGGPSTAAAEWVVDFLNYAQREGSPLDFISTHTYGNLPLNFKEALKAANLPHIEVLWTEWGITPTHFARVNDAAFGAPFVLHGMKSAQNHADALAYWVVSDHFEELGRAPKLFHGGFGLLSVGNLHKPRYWALALLEEMGRDLVHAELQGDGAGSLIDSWVTRKADGTLDVLVWNGTLDQSKIDGDPLLDRQIRIHLEQLLAESYHCSITRIDMTHSNITTHWTGQTDWPTPEQWDILHAADTLAVEEMPDVVATHGAADLAFTLPMPGVVRLRLTPTR
ncbi:GH39 family glycosyl hydrolase [Ktedonospora formicarum]|nr:hypothetical protein [Ktedonospora formicarum]